jgi:cytochrome P450
MTAETVVGSTDAGAGAGVPPSPAGPAADGDLSRPAPPLVDLPRGLTTLRVSVRQIELVFKARRELGETFRLFGRTHEQPAVVVSHPDHVKSLFTADPADAPTVTANSQLRPVVGPNSVLTAVGERHMRQRKLLLPAFHGEAVARYRQMIAEAAEREIDSWPVGTPFALAPRMQAITLDVIMAGIFGIEGRPPKGSPEDGLRRAVRSIVALSTIPITKIAELSNMGKEEPVGFTRAVLAWLDRKVYAVIAARRAGGGGAGRGDILSMLLGAEAEDGERLSDKEVRDELLTLVLAGHETTANSLAWAFERLLRTPAAYDRLREAVRSGEGGEDYVEATIHEAMRARPVIPIIGRIVKRPWRLGEYVVPAESEVLASILLLHHREDVYPDPFAFRPERFLGVKPGTYTWIPFGGGIRRCLGATLAMAEQRVVLEAIARRLDLEAPDPRPERARHRNVTMIPAGGTRVVVRHRR